MKPTGEFLEDNFFYFMIMRDIVKRLFEYYAERNLSKLYNIPEISIEYDKLNEHKFFFVLGGGPSINLLNEKNWEIIKNNISLGLNNWMVHPFEPDYLMIEGFRDSEINTERYNWTDKYLPVYIKNSRSKILLKDIKNSHLNWNLLSNIMDNKTFIIPKFSVPGRNNESRKKVMNILGKVKIAKHFPLFSRVSVTLAISIGYLLGFKKIVLCGIDMNNADYFFEDKNFKSHPLVPILPTSGQLNKEIHSTVNKEINPITADRSILDFYEQILQNDGVKLYVNSKDSILFPRIPAFEWNEQQHV